MSSLINWCNENEGFINAIMALISLLLSFLAIIISISTARLPFKKGIKLKHSYAFYFTRGNVSKDVKSSLVGMSINAANIGFRNINLSFLGLGVRDTEKPWKYKKIAKLENDDTNRGIVEPTEITTVQYDIISLLYAFDMLSPKTKIYVLAQDSEGKVYHKYIGKANIISDYIMSNK